MSNELHIYQINLHRAYAPTSELNTLVRSKLAFIALVQEPTVRSSKITGLDRKIGNTIGRQR